MPDIFVIDDQNPEDIAMLQALYSRSPASVTAHLEKLKNVGSGKFMEQFYVGYGHSSIGDCGNTTVFIEQVSLLAAKAIQDTPLYNGQEASTRYLDFSKQTLLDPYQSPETTRVLATWMALYNHIRPLLVESLKQEKPYQAGDYRSEKIWENLIQARSFDIARSLLPLGISTLLSWTTSLRAARDHLRRLKHHPLPEIRGVAESVFDGLITKYPHSFKSVDIEVSDTDTRDTYAQDFATSNHVLMPDTLLNRFGLTVPAGSPSLFVADRRTLDLEGLRSNETATLSERPAGAALPRRLESYGLYNFLFLIDFGSFRDIQRHRNGVCQIPFVDGRFGFHPWYGEEFKKRLSAAESSALFAAIEEQYATLKTLSQGLLADTPLQAQYLYPLGTQVLAQCAYSVPETIYVGELRSAKTVHPTLRPIAQAMLSTLAHDLPAIALHGDMTAETWCAKRGEQTIEMKK